MNEDNYTKYLKKIAKFINQPIYAKIDSKNKITVYPNGDIKESKLK